MKENKKSVKRIIINYVVLAAILLAIIGATIGIVFAVKAANDRNLTIDNQEQEQPDDGDNNPPAITTPDDGKDDGDNTPTTTDYTFVTPVSDVDILTGYTFYKNNTLNCYYLHTGMDFAAEQGTPVYAVLDGIVESVTRDNVLDGTVVTILHENGLRTTYGFIDADEELAAGDKVTRGEQIGTIAAPTGREYKDGPHLHFEVISEGKSVDPEQYLDVADK